MKNLSVIYPVLTAGLILSGCSGAFWGGTAGGTAATGAAYELRSRQQMKKIEDEYKNFYIGSWNSP